MWLAPEIIRKQPYTEKVDVYSFAMICYELITRQTPFSDIAFLFKVEKKLMAGIRPPLPTATKALGVPAEFLELIRDCWAQDPLKRPSFPLVVQRLTGLMQTYYPDQAAYDTQI